MKQRFANIQSNYLSQVGQLLTNYFLPNYFCPTVFSVWLIVDTTKLYLDEIIQAVVWVVKVDRYYIPYIYVAIYLLTQCFRHVQISNRGSKL